MRKYAMDFLRRGLAACGLGPLVLAVIYLIMQHNRIIETLTVNEVCTAIISLSILAFVAGGMNFIYQIEQLPLMVAILVHGIVLYVTYLVTFLLNGWLEQGMTPVLIFTVIFVLGYLVIWAIIYSIIKRNTARINTMLQKKQHL